MAVDLPRPEWVSLAPLCEDDAGALTDWRNASRVLLRTPTLTTVEEQRDFISTCQSDRRRYWALRPQDEIAGVVGLNPIQWENRAAEISLLVDPDKTRTGIGSEAVRLVLTEAFENMGLATVWGECYHCNPALGFWQRMIDIYRGTSVVIPRRKMWRGKLWDALWFTFSVDEWQTHD